MAKAIITRRLFPSVIFIFAVLMPSVYAYSAGSRSAGDLWTLQRCIGYAIRNNPDLQSAEAAMAASAYDLSYQRKLFLPRLELNAESGYLTGRPTSPFATVRGVTEEGLRSRTASGEFAIGSLTLTIPIVKEGSFFSKNAPSIKKSESQNLLDKSTYEAKKNALANTIGSSFIELLKNKEDVKAAEEHIKSLKLDHDLAAGKYRQQLLSKNDLLISEVKLAF